MPKISSSKGLSTVGSSGNLLYPCKQRGLHPDGLPRAYRSSACYIAYRRCNPRGGLDYVITTIGQSWEMVTEYTNILTQERHFLPDLKNWVSMPKIR